MTRALPHMNGEESLARRVNSGGGCDFLRVALRRTLDGLIAGALLGRLLGARQVEAGVDERHVAEGLRVIALLASQVRLVLLGQQAEVVADGEQALEQLFGVGTAADRDIGV